MVCIGPLGWQDRTAVQTDIANFQAALQAVQPTEAFLPTVSPGTLAQNVINEYYKDEETFLFAVAEVMREEYHAIVQAGFLLQIDSPDLAMGWHTQSQTRPWRKFRTIMTRRVEALNHALSGLPPERVRHHICWGNGERPHHKDVELQHIIDILLTARTGARDVEGANPRHGHEWKVFRKGRLPEGMVVIPGVIDTKTNIIEHPELCRTASCTMPVSWAARTSLAGHGRRLWHQCRSDARGALHLVRVKLQRGGRGCPVSQRPALGIRDGACRGDAATGAASRAQRRSHMQRSTHRILTTHVGSLARPDVLIPLLRLKERGQPYDTEAFAPLVREAVADVVRKQVEAWDPKTSLPMVNRARKASLGISTIASIMFAL